MSFRKNLPFFWTRSARCEWACVRESPLGLYNTCFWEEYFSCIVYQNFHSSRQTRLQNDAVSICRCIPPGSKSSLKRKLTRIQRKTLIRSDFKSQVTVFERKQLLRDLCRTKAEIKAQHHGYLETVERKESRVLQKKKEKRLYCWTRLNVALASRRLK